MIVVAILIASLLLFRGFGALGVPLFGTWIASTRCALSVMFLFTSIAHFNKFRHDLVRMMPAVFRNPMPLIYFTGVCEILGAIGILAPPTRSFAGFCLCVFLLAIFSENIKAARENLTLGGRIVTALWLRMPMQILFLFLICWRTQPWRVFSPLLHS